MAAKTGKTRPLRGRAALKSAAAALGYEWGMARASALRLGVAMKHDDQVAVNMALECFLLHARNIRDFFAADGRPNDVLSRDFFGRPIRVALPLLRSSRMQNRLNRRVAHLSYSRSYLGRFFPVDKLLAEIETAMTRFEKRLRSRDPDLADALINA